MKKAGSFVFSLAVWFGILLSACGAETKPAASAEPAVSTEPVASVEPSMAEQETEEMPISFMRSGYPFGGASDHGYYYLRYRDDASMNICYIDYETNQQIVLCSQPNCLHNSETCPAWIPYHGSTAGVYEISGKLYVIQYGALSSEDYDVFGEAAAARIEVREVDGTNAADLLRLPFNCYFCSPFANDGSYLYGMIQETKTLEDDSVEATIKLVRISLQDGALETLDEIDQISPDIAGASGRFLCLSYYKEDSTGEIPSNLCYEAYDVTTGEITQLCSFSLSNATGICVGDRLLCIDKETHEAKTYDIQTGEERVLYPLPLDNYSDVRCSYALPDSVLLLLYSEDPDAGVVHALLSIDSGELFEFTQAMDSDETSLGKAETIKIIAENEGNFVILSGVHYESVAFKVDEGEPLSLPSPYYDVSIIPKTDFLNHIDSYTEVEDLVNQ